MLHFLLLLGHVVTDTYMMAMPGLAEAAGQPPGSVGAGQPPGSVGV